MLHRFFLYNNGIFCLSTVSFFTLFFEALKYSFSPSYDVIAEGVLFLVIRDQHFFVTFFKAMSYVKMTQDATRNR